jgi:hypothetical protein
LCLNNGKIYLNWTAAMKLGRTTLAPGESHLKNNLFDCGTHKRTKIFASVLLVAYAPGVHIVICFWGVTFVDFYETRSEWNIFVVDSAERRLCSRST